MSSVSRRPQQLPRTDSVAELRHRAQLYQQGRFPQQADAMQQPLPPPVSSRFAYRASTDGRSSRELEAALRASEASTQTLPRTPQRPDDDRYFSDSGCSTCSGSAHGGDETHSDCVSCNSSCSCTSGCESDDGFGDQRSRARGQTSSTRRQRQPARHQSPDASRESLDTTVAAGASPLHPHGHPARAQLMPSVRDQVEAAKRARARTEEQARAYAQQRARELSSQEAKSADERARRLAAEQAADADADSLHVAFSSEDAGRGMAESLQPEQKQAIYDSALSSITRAEQGFCCYVLTSEHAATMHTLGAPPAASLLRKLLRYEPRRTAAATSNATAAMSACDSAFVGSGTLAWFDLLFGGANSPQKFRPNAAERAAQAQRDLDETVVRSEHNAAGQPATPLASRHSASIKSVRLTIDRKAGLIPVRRIGELRVGLAPSAVRLVHAVNQHFEELSIAEDETIDPDCCVSIMLHGGGGSQKHSDAAEHSHATDEHVQGEYDAKHEACIAKFRPEIAPRVQSSFSKTAQTSSHLVQREIRRNQRKMGVRNPSQSGVAGFTAAAASSGRADASHARAAAPSPSPSRSVSSWVVVALNSREEAHALLNSLLFLKLVAGASMQRKTEDKREVVTVPLGEAPLPSPNRSRRAPPVVQLQPDELTSVLMHVGDDATAHARATPVKPASSPAHYLRRHSQPTPSVKADFPLPAAIQRTATKAKRQTEKPIEESKEAPAVKTLAEQWAEAVTASKAPIAALEDEEYAYEQKTEFPDASPASPPRSHDLSSSTAIFTPAQVRAFHAPVAASPPSSVAEWQAQKAAAAERAKEREQRKQRKLAAEKAAKDAENKIALDRWTKQQAENDAKRRIAKGKADAEAKRLADEKAAAKSERRAAAVKAYKKFLDTYEQKRAKAAAAKDAKQKQATTQSRDKKREAKKRFADWVKRKSDWFVRRVAQIKQRARERNERGDGDNDDDPEEEAALDWKWLEREVENEIAAASPLRADNFNLREPSDDEPHQAYADDRSAAEFAAAQAAAVEADTELLYSMLNEGELTEAEVELWQRLIEGISTAKQEVERLQLHQPSHLQQSHSHLSEAWAQTDPALSASTSSHRSLVAHSSLRSGSSHSARAIDDAELDESLADRLSHSAYFDADARPSPFRMHGIRPREN